MQCNYTQDILKSSSTPYGGSGSAVSSATGALNHSGFAGNAVIVHGGAVAVDYGNRGNAHGPVNGLCYNYPAGGNYRIMCAIMVTHGAIKTPCQWMPGTVPNGVYPPGIR